MNNPRFGTRSIWVDITLFEQFKKEVKLQGLTTLSEMFCKLLRQGIAEMHGASDPKGEVAEDVGKKRERLDKLVESLGAERLRLEKLLKTNGDYDYFMGEVHEIVAKYYGPSRDPDEFKDVNLESVLRGGPETDRFRQTVSTILDAGKKGRSIAATYFVHLMRIIRQQLTIKVQLDSLEPGSVVNAIPCGSPESAVEVVGSEVAEPKSEEDSEEDMEEDSEEEEE